MSHKNIIADKIDVQKDLVALSKIFKNAGFSLYLVGGALRDMYLKRKNYDIDVATDARPEDVVRLFRKTIPTGIKHGTVTIRFRGRNIECTTMRRDVGYSDGRRPDLVEYGSCIQEDLSRRDFSMNAIAASLPEGEIIDPYSGKKDIENKIIRAVGEPLMRFSEDGLRPMRALRFASQLGFKVEENTLRAIPLSLEKMKGVSIERFQDEFNKMLRGEYFPFAMLLMKKTSVLHLFLPYLDAIEDPSFHQMLHAVSFISKEALTLRLSLICYWIYDAENVCSFKKIETMLKNLKYPNKTIEEVLHLIQYCNFKMESLESETDIRVFLKNVGKENVENIFKLKRAIVFARTMLMTSSFNMKKDFIKESSYNSKQRLILDSLKRIERDVQAVLEENPPLSIKELAINGDDLLNLGFQKGPKLGKILHKLLDLVLDSPKNNKKEYLIDEAYIIDKELFL